MDYTNWLVAALLCALLFTDWRFDIQLPDVQLTPLLTVPWFPAAIAALLLFYIAMNSSS